MSFVLDDVYTISIDQQPNPSFPSLSVLMRFVTPLPTLPPMTFTDPSHFSIDHTTITRIQLERRRDGKFFWSSLLLSDPFTSGIVSITITILRLASPSGRTAFGLMDPNNPIPAVGEALGFRVKKSVSLHNFGYLNFYTPSIRSNQRCHSELNQGDCVRMEVDLDSTPRTVQFFVNGEAGRCYVSGIPSSVRIGFSVYKQGLSFRIDNISRLSQPTPISDEMKEVKW